MFCVVATLSGGLAIVSSPLRASANSDEAAFIADTNATRESHGLPPLAVSGDLTSIARSWTAHMAASQTLAHNPNLTSEVQNWQAIGENVGSGPDEPHIQRGFMSTPEHRANILSSRYTQFGVAAARDSKGVLWVTVDFRQPMGTTSSVAVSSPARRYTLPSRPASPPINMAAVIRGRLRAEQAAVRKRHITDPVAQAFSYVNVMATLTR